ncbi:TRAP transporter substrate-binding protein [Anoxynatronum sibiricum]|uniref:TRAP transporter substrate-binding protein n=1 Tax=Anoxynatronum sibiricum TaxID=210623 RepID=A0ABU9VRC0_9CLOT
MNQKKRWLVVLLVGLLTAGLMSGCGGGAAAPDAPPAADAPAASAGDAPVQAKTLRVAFNQPESHPQFKAMVSFGEKLAERTGGAYQVEVSPNELLGPQRETIELVQTGTIEMAIVAGSLLENFNPDYVVFNLPYMFSSRDHQMAVVNDMNIVGDLYRSTADQGMIAVGAFHGGVRNVYTRSHPIHTPADLAGQKIRVMESDTNIRMMQMMGGTGTPMGQGEVYTAIQSGVLDGGENNELIFAGLKHAEIAPYYSYTQHLMMPDMLIINTDLFDGMPQEHQDIFMEELRKAVDLQVQLWDEDVAVAMEEAIEAGASFNDVDISVFQENVKPLVEEKITTETAREIYEKVQAAAR